MFAINIKADLKPLQRAFVALGSKQVPFAQALALNNLAKGVMAQERALIDKTFDKATPFTENAYRMEVATKTKPVAVVAAKDSTNDKGGQAAYLAPYVFGGDRSLGGKQAMLVPAGAKVNQYGNLPKGLLARLKGKPDVFIGSIRFRKSGETVSGVWQRNPVPRGQRRDGAYGTRGNNQNVIGGTRTTLKLLIQFEDTTPVQKNLDFYGSANAYLRKNVAPEFNAAIKRALATAR